MRGLVTFSGSVSWRAWFSNLVRVHTSETISEMAIRATLSSVEMNQTNRTRVFRENNQLLQWTTTATGDMTRFSGKIMCDPVFRHFLKCLESTEKSTLAKAESWKSELQRSRQREGSSGMAWIGQGPSESVAKRWGVSVGRWPHFFSLMIVTRVRGFWIHRDLPSIHPSHHGGKNSSVAAMAAKNRRAVEFFTATTTRNAFRRAGSPMHGGEEVVLVNFLPGDPTTAFFTRSISESPSSHLGQLRADYGEERAVGIALSQFSTIFTSSGTFSASKWTLFN